MSSDIIKLVERQDDSPRVLLCLDDSLLADLE